MTAIAGLFLLTICLAAALATIAIWSPRRLAVKLVAVAALVLFLPLAWAAFVELLSRPKPAALEWVRAQADEAIVLASSIDEGQSIYVWLKLAEVPEPRAYVLPWDPELALQLQEATRAADGAGIAMRLPFEPSLDDLRPRFYPLPQPALPPKDEERTAPGDVDSLAKDI